ncbi:hypothetical protein G7083_05760 [Vibrio sp. HDW18]|uniref:hypothetical protein n=1 Tax=Vibrio sp. HDW18 TaxID=2714948 RepID=UPI001408E9BD|nr:hypothetical protein [Vibrio sp. HDW18]QIL85434.1 hypothetical protein G7083_05760 [Vibrio sp. HDW18]
MPTTIETYSKTTISTLNQASNHTDSNNLSGSIYSVKQSNEQKCHKVRISPLRKPLPLEDVNNKPMSMSGLDSTSPSKLFSLDISSNRMLENKSIDVNQLAVDSALSAVERALTCDFFTAVSLKNNFRQLATGNGSLRTMATALQSFIQFGSDEIKVLADELLNKQIILVPFSQFGTYSGMASNLIEEASMDMLEEIVVQLNDIYDVVSKNILGKQV